MPPLAVHIQAMKFSPNGHVTVTFMIRMNNLLIQKFKVHKNLRNSASMCACIGDAASHWLAYVHVPLMQGDV
jgi:hypothetical protein